MQKIPFDKIAFVLSLTAFAFLYGFAASTRGWFPNDLLVAAWRQARAIWTQANATDKMPRLDYIQDRIYDRAGVRIEEPQNIQPGMTLILSLWKEFDWKPGAKLIDVNGRMLHAWEVDGDQLFPDPPKHRTKRDPNRTNIHGAYLFANGDIVVNLSYVGAVRLDPCGRLLWQIPAGNHHSIARADDGSFWITGGSWDPPEQRSGQSMTLPGLDERVYHDRILHVSEAGEVLNELDVLDVLYANGLQRYIPKGSAYPPPSMPDDITHLNDVEPLEASMAGEYPLFASGDLLISIHHLDLVLVLDPRSKQVKWHASEPFIQQHDPDFWGSGWIGVFDNNRDGTRRGTMLGGSRIVLLQPHTDSLKIIFPTELSEPFYTKVQGEWQQLENGNLLLTESQAGRVVEVAPDGRTVWEWVAEPYKETGVPEVTDATRHDLTYQQVEAWPCSPEESTGNREEPES